MGEDTSSSTHTVPSNILNLRLIYLGEVSSTSVNGATHATQQTLYNSTPCLTKSTP